MFDNVVVAPWAVLGGVVVILTGLRQIFHWQENYVRFTSAWLTLRHERRRYDVGEPPYHDFALRDRKLMEVVNAVEAKETRGWAELLLTGVQAIPNVGPAAATRQAGEVAVPRRSVSPLRGYPGGACQSKITARERSYAARRIAHAGPDGLERAAAFIHPTAPTSDRVRAGRGPGGRSLAG